ncbi:hypothetical protein FKP32DRAFT_37264 [Trametes sanguinea]|nr:hypothetical protein FKP32DRAFT_37264 [Trametes sanguinea]
MPSTLKPYYMGASALWGALPDTVFELLEVRRAVLSVRSPTCAFVQAIMPPPSPNSVSEDLTGVKRERDLEPPAKRRRQDTHRAAHEGFKLKQTADTVARSSNVWFSDGNVVLIADHKAAFRVHRGVLAHHSPVFGDIFKVPQPGDAETFDGCAVLHISDPPADVEYLLRALYDGPKFSANKSSERLPFAVAAALVELGHKYDIEHLRDETLLRIKSCLLHKFSEFRCKIEYGTVEENDCICLMLRSPTLCISTNEDAIRAVNLVRLVGDNRMLPMALYLCTQLPITALLSGTTRPGGVIDTLSREDQVRCLHARAIFSERNRKKLARLWQSALPRDCRAPGGCQSALLGHACEELRSSAAVALPNCLFSSDVSRTVQALELCDRCAEHLYELAAQEVLLIWEKLPEDLDLDVTGWESAPAA